MSEFNEKSARKDEKDNVCDEEDFVPRFVKVFNESKVYDTRTSEIGEQNKDTSRKKTTNKTSMTSLKHDVKMTTSPLLSYEEHRRCAFKDGAAFSIDKSALCKSMQMSHNANERRKKIVRTNTDSEIIIPKVDEPDDAPFNDTPLEEILSPNTGSMENLKERLKEGKCFYW
jgi:hypothetical protein